MTTPLVAIVTPVYNGADYLAEAMDSVQAQTYPKLVHVVLDNASTDATPEILSRYQVARVPVVVKRNAQTLPIGPNWNAAVRLTPADAAYFRVLCADDILSPDFVAHTVDLAEHHPSVMVVGCKLRHRGANPDNAGWEADRSVFSGREAAERFFLGTGLIVAHQTLMRRRALDLRKPFFEECMTTNDTETCLDLLRHGDWGFVHETLAITRDHPDTDSNTRMRRLHLDVCEYLVLLKRYAPFALGVERGEALYAKFRRYYLRQVLRWRAQGRRDIFEEHASVLRQLGAPITASAMLDALIDWPLARLQLRPTWHGYPFGWAH